MPKTEQFLVFIAFDAIANTSQATATDADVVDALMCFANRTLCDGHLKTTGTSSSEKPIANIVA